jgi:hypothetical protein
MKRFLTLFAALSIPIAAFTAEPEKTASPGQPGAPAEPAKTPAPAGEVKAHAPTDLAALKPLKGQKILLEGKIVSSGANKADSIRYLNFTKNFRESVSLVFFANSGGGTFTKDALAKFVGKTVRVNGTLSEYNDALQIRIESLDQVKVIEETPATPPPGAPAK